MSLLNKYFWMLVFSSLVIPPTVLGQVVLGQLDDFQNETTQKWLSDVRDVGNPNPPSSTAGVGPGGTGDHALSLSSNGTAGPGGKLVALNQSQWAGDYLAAGVTGISLNLNNLGASDLSIRLAFHSSDELSDTWFSTITSFFLPAGSGWQSAVIPIADGDLLRLTGTLDYKGTMSTVDETRILHNNDPAFRGVLITANVLVDNITAVPEPETCVLWVGLAAFGYATWRNAGLRKQPVVPFKTRS